MDNNCISRGGSHRDRRGVGPFTLCLALVVTLLMMRQGTESLDAPGTLSRAFTAAPLAGGFVPAAVPSPLRLAFIATRMAEAREEHAFVTVKPEEGFFGALNPDQSLLFEVSPRAVAVAPAVDGPAAWRTEIRLQGLGRSDRITPVPEAVPEVQNGRVTYRKGLINEWYLNGPLGLEQGFDVLQRPEGGGPLIVQVSIGGGPQPRLDEASGSVVLRQGTEGHLLYSDLFAVDEDGRPLEARMGVKGKFVLLQVDDSQARYPVRIDPLIWLQQQKLTASDGAAIDLFGNCVSIDGDTAAVGANSDDIGTNADQGSAYVFVRNAGVWSQQAKLTAADGAASDHFGSRVAISGDTVLVSAIQDDVGANVDQGSAYIFTRSGTVWSQQAKLTASGGGARSWFGWSAAISGDTAVIGAIQDDVGANVDQGSAYVFLRSGTAWSQQAILTASDGEAGDNFGSSVAISADTAVVGAFFDIVGANAEQGSAYVFVRSGLSWSQQAKLTASDGASGDNFGWFVAISGDRVVSGAGSDDVGTNDDQGSAYIFERSGTTWSQQAKLISSDGAAGDYFGVSGAISGDTAVVGARQDEVGSNRGQGSAYIFVHGTGGWSQQAKLVAPDGDVNDLFGWTVAFSGDTVIVGATRDDVGARTDQGSAYVFLGRLEDGDPCISASQCHSGYCVDDVCCEDGCGGGILTDCQACSTSLGGDVNGVCGPLNATFAPTVTCRPSAGVCDVAEVCSSTSTICPDDAFTTASTMCRSPAGLCDAAELCTGTSALCPDDVLAASSEICRAASGACDVPELCTGVSMDCPADTFEPEGTVCLEPECSDNEATPAGTCDGFGTCAIPDSVPCEPYICGPTECLTSCDDSTDCFLGYECVGAQCLPPDEPDESGETIIEEVDEDAGEVVAEDADYEVNDLVPEVADEDAGEILTDLMDDSDAATDGEEEMETPPATGGCGCGGAI